MALDFDGVDDSVTHGDIAAVDGAAAMTISLWLNLDATTGIDVLVAKFVSTADCWRWSMGGGGSTPDGGLWFDINGNFGSTAGGLLTAGTWHHVAVRYDGAGVGDAARLKTYIDGSERALTFTGTIPATLPSNAASVVVGLRVVGGIQPLDGKLGLFRLWTRALSEAEIANEYRSYRAAFPSSNIVESPYDDGTSSRDYSGSGNHGTVAGALAVQGPPVNVGSPILG